MSVVAYTLPVRQPDGSHVQMPVSEDIHARYEAGLYAALHVPAETRWTAVMEHINGWNGLLAMGVTA